MTSHYEFFRTLRVIFVLFAFIGTLSAIGISYTPVTPESGIETEDTSLQIEVQITEPSETFENAVYNLYNSRGELVSSQTVSDKTAFMLEHYDIEVENRDLDLGADQSGLAYCPTTDTLFSVRNGVAIINELYKNGTLKREIRTSGFQDIEAITFINNSGGYDWFAITEERRQNFSIIKINSETSRITYAEANNYDMDIGTSPNKGLEGIAYDKTRNVFYVMKEKDERALYQVDVSSGSVEKTVLFDAQELLSGIVRDLSDIYHDSNTDTLFIVSHESRKIIQLERDGTILGTIRNTLPQGEGITFDNSGETMWVISEPDIWNVYKANSFTSTHTFTDLPAGVYFYSVTAHNSVGESSTTPEREITIDTGENRLPVLEEVVLQTDGEFRFTNENVNLNWESNDPEGHEVKGTVNWYLDDELITVLNMPFEAGSDAHDYASGTDATVNDAVWIRDAGHDGFGAYSFADDASIVLDSGTGYLSSYTFSARIKRDSTAEWDIFAYGNNNAQYFAIHPGRTDSLVVSYRNSTGAQRTCYTNTKINDTEWHHIVITGESEGYIRMYIDGVQDRTSSCKHPYNNGGFAEYSLIEQLGAYRSAGYGFDGSMDDVQVFNRALSPEQVTELYENSGTIVSQETEPGDVWRACVIPNDGIEDGLQVCSNRLEIAVNEAPVVESISLENIGGELRLLLDTSDAEDDPIKSIMNWYVVDRPITRLNMPFEAPSSLRLTKEYVSNSYATVNNAIWNPNRGHDGFGSYQFNDDASIIAPSTGYMDRYTFSAWVKLDSPGEWDIFGYGNNSGQYFAIHPNNVGSFIVSYRNRTGYQKTCYSDIKIDDSEWHHVAATGESDGYIRMYIDGVRSGTRNCRHPHNNGGFGDYALIEKLGSWKRPGYGFDGLLDDVQVFDVVLSPEQIRAIYEGSATISSDDMEDLRICAIPNDGIQDGSEACSREV